MKKKKKAARITTIKTRSLILWRVVIIFAVLFVCYNQYDIRKDQKVIIKEQEISQLMMEYIWYALESINSNNINTMEKGKGLRYNEGKLRYDLLHPKALEGVVGVITAGAVKYEERNWESGMKWTTVLASLKRHLAAIERGEDFDEESGLKHIDHLQCNAHFLSAYYHIYPQGDDRPNTYFTKRVALDIDGVIADFNEAVKKEENIAKNPDMWFYSYKFNSALWERLNINKDFWVNIKPYFDGKDLPFEPVAYVTHRGVPKTWCEEWIEKNNFPCVPVHVVKESKIEVLKDLNVDIFIEDSYKNFVELNNAGIFTYLLDRPWNKRYDVGHRRIYNLSEII